LDLEYVLLAPGFVREAIAIYDSWEGKATIPMKIQELMMLLQIEVNKRYNPRAPPEKPKFRVFRDLRLDRMDYSLTK
jgi:hypothetical protein